MKFNVYDNGKLVGRVYADCYNTAYDRALEKYAKVNSNIEIEEI